MTGRQTSEFDCMNRYLLAFVLGLLAIPIGAETSLVCNVPKINWLSEADVTKKLKQQGYLVKTVRIEKGCYEIYGLDPLGRRIQILFDPETAKPVTSS